MNHECIQSRRLFIIERDAAAEVAKRTETYDKILETMGKIGDAIANLGENTNRELQALRKEVSGLAKKIDKKK